MKALLNDRDPCGNDCALISLDDACRRAARYVSPVEGMDQVGLEGGFGRVLAKEIFATVALPPFDQSAMDGYAFAASEAALVATRLTIASRVPAGSRPESLGPGTAARVFTGAPIPPGADTVIMQEHVRCHGDSVFIEGPVRRGSNVRRRGEDIAEGESLLPAGQRLDARHLALLAAQGVSAVPVVRRARIAVVSTGDELRMPGETLDRASVFDSNRPMLLALAHQAGLEVHDGGTVPDCPAAMAQRLFSLAETADLVVTTGGASVGDEDHSAAVLASIEAPFEVLKIAIKPGKPAVVGRIGSAAYLGLPGNPVSALVSWLTVGSAMIATLCRMKPGQRIGCPMRTVSHFERRAGRTEFVPARLVLTEDGPRVEILGRGGSARLKPLINADGLAEIAASAGDLHPGDNVTFHAFRSSFVT